MTAAQDTVEDALHSVCIHSWPALALHFPQSDYCMHAAANVIVAPHDLGQSASSSNCCLQQCHGQPGAEYGGTVQHNMGSSKISSMHERRKSLLLSMTPCTCCICCVQHSCPGVCRAIPTSAHCWLRCSEYWLT